MLPRWLKQIIVFSISAHLGIILPVFPVFAVGAETINIPPAVEYTPGTLTGYIDNDPMAYSFDKAIAKNKSMKIGRFSSKAFYWLDKYLTGEKPNPEIVNDAKSALRKLSVFVERHKESLAQTMEGSDAYIYTKALVKQGNAVGQRIGMLVSLAENNNGRNIYKKTKDAVLLLSESNIEMKAKQARKTAFLLEARRQRWEESIIRAFAGTGIKINRVEIASEWRKYELDANNQWESERVDINHGETPLILKTSIGEIKALSKPRAGRTDFMDPIQPNKLIASFGHATKQWLDWGIEYLPPPPSLVSLLMPDTAVAVAAEKNSRGEVIKKHMMYLGKVVRDPIRRNFFKGLNWIYSKAETLVHQGVNGYQFTIGEVTGWKKFRDTAEESITANWRQLFGKKIDGKVNRNLAAGQAHHLLGRWGWVNDISLRIGTGFLVAGGMSRFLPKSTAPIGNGKGLAGRQIPLDKLKGGFNDTAGKYAHLLNPELAVPAPSAPLPDIFNFGAGGAPTGTTPSLIPTTATTTGTGLTSLLAGVLDGGDGSKTRGEIRNDTSDLEIQTGFILPSWVSFVITPDGLVPVGEFSKMMSRYGVSLSALPWLDGDGKEKDKQIKKWKKLLEIIAKNVKPGKSAFWQIQEYLKRIIVRLPQDSKFNAIKEKLRELVRGYEELHWVAKSLESHYQRIAKLYSIPLNFSSLKSPQQLADADLRVAKALLEKGIVTPHTIQILFNPVSDKQRVSDSIYKTIELLLPKIARRWADTMSSKWKEEFCPQEAENFLREKLANAKKDKKVMEFFKLLYRLYSSCGQIIKKYDDIGDVWVANKKHTEELSDIFSICIRDAYKYLRAYFPKDIESLIGSIQRTKPTPSQPATKTAKGPERIFTPVPAFPTTTITHTVTTTANEARASAKITNETERKSEVVRYGYVGPSNIPLVHTSDTGMILASQAAHAGYSPAQTVVMQATNKEAEYKRRLDYIKSQIGKITYEDIFSLIAPLLKDVVADAGDSELEDEVTNLFNRLSKIAQIIDNLKTHYSIAVANGIKVDFSSIRTLTDIENIEKTVVALLNQQTGFITPRGMRILRHSLSKDSRCIARAKTIDWEIKKIVQRWVQTHKKMKVKSFSDGKTVENYLRKQLANALTVSEFFRNLHRMYSSCPQPYEENNDIDAAWEWNKRHTHEVKGDFTAKWFQTESLFREYAPNLAQ